MKIYISSTYSDLKNHRQAVATALRRMGHQVLGMEDYVAEGIRPLSRCLEDVEAADAYVGIVAWRYGFVPTDAGRPTVPAIPGATLGSTSITEFEYRKAVASKKLLMVFLLDPQAEWPAAFVDAISGDGEQGKSIVRLRQELSQGHMVNHFRTADELASLVSAAVYRAEVGRQMSIESLNIEARLNIPEVQSGGAAVNDSALATIVAAIAGPVETQAVQIDIGQGYSWWMSRLYFLASLATELTSAEVMLFLGENKAFLGILHPRIVRDQLAKVYPDLSRFDTTLATSGAPLPDLPGEVQRRAAIWQNTFGATEHLNPAWVTRREMERWFAPYLVTDAVEWDAIGSDAMQMLRLLDWPGRFVPVVEKRAFQRVVDKRALTEQIARLFVREQVARALSMTR